MTPEQFVNHVNKYRKEIEQCFKHTLPIKVGAIAQAHFRDNFVQGGFINGGLQKWEPAKRLSKGGSKVANKYKTLTSGRNNLFNEIKYAPGVAEVYIRNKAPYAAVHNEGLRAGRGAGFIMPKRQFIGESKELNVKVENKIEEELRNIINK